MSIKQFVFVDDNGDYTDLLVDGTFDKRECVVSSDLGDFVYESLSIPNGVDTSISNTDKRSIVGIIIDKIDDTHCIICTSGEISGFTGLVPSSKLYHASNGKSTMVKPIEGYLTILGTCKNTTTITFDPVNTKVLIHST